VQKAVTPEALQKRRGWESEVGGVGKKKAIDLI
jgi:hypothetical protein